MISTVFCEFVLILPHPFSTVATASQFIPALPNSFHKPAQLFYHISSQLFLPRPTSSQLFSTFLTSAHLFSTHLASSQLISPLLNSSLLNSSQLYSPLVNSSQLFSTTLTSAHRFSALSQLFSPLATCSQLFPSPLTSAQLFYAQRSLYTKQTFTQSYTRSFYTEVFAHGAFTHRSFYTEKLLHTTAFTHTHTSFDVEIRSLNQEDCVDTLGKHEKSAA